MLSKRNCRKSHFVLTFLYFLWFIRIFQFFVVHNTEKSKLSFFSKRVIALTAVGINHQNTENFRFWRPFLPQNQVFIKMWKFCFLCCRMVFGIILWQTITILSHFEQIIIILKRFHYFVNFSHIVLRRTALPKLQKTCFFTIWWCCYLGRKH